jgi:hypothetical protein
MPCPSFKYRKKFHKYTDNEFKELIDTFLYSNLNIGTFYKEITNDKSNIFSEYKETSFRKLINKGLNSRGLKYVSNNKWGFKIIPLE